MAQVVWQELQLSNSTYSQRRAIFTAIVQEHCFRQCNASASLPTETSRQPAFSNCWLAIEQSVRNFHPTSIQQQKLIDGNYYGSVGWFRRTRHDQNVSGWFKLDFEGTNNTQVGLRMFKIFLEDLRLNLKEHTTLKKESAWSNVVWMILNLFWRNKILKKDSAWSKIVWVI